MNYKKNIAFGGIGLIIILLVIGLIVKEKNGLYLKNASNQEGSYKEYVEKTLADAIMNEKGIVDCIVDTEYANNEFVSAKVCVTIAGDEIGISEKEIVEYVSNFLEIPDKYIEYNSIPDAGESSDN